MNKILKFSLPMLLVAALVLIGGCAPAHVPTPVLTPTPVPAPTPPKESVTYGASSDVTSYDVSTERKIVKTGYITLEVEDIAGTIDKVAQLAEELGGYVVSSQKNGDAGEVSGSVSGEAPVPVNTSGSISIRVPADKFDEAYGKLRQLAITVPNESTQATDVTEQYVDLQARLNNLEATEAQYLTLMEKAQTVEDMLAVQQQLSNVRGEIEQIKGQMLYLERTSDMALIQVTLQKTAPLSEPWGISSAFKSAVRGLTAFGRGLATVLIWLGVFCWVWIPPLVIWLRRRKAKAKA
jgi:hypothetical protein